MYPLKKTVRRSEEIRETNEFKTTKTTLRKILFVPNSMQLSHLCHINKFGVYWRKIETPSYLNLFLYQ